VPVPTLPEERFQELLAPFLSGCRRNIPESLLPRLSVYLDLLLRWNARTNLTAIRDPEQIVSRHFGESLFAGCCLAGRMAEGTTLLDLGSGAGFPGLPIQLLYPETAVVLAESQGKKAAFLREAVRALGVKTEVWAARVETMPPDRLFEVVTLRAVDRMESMRAVGLERLRAGGQLVELATGTAEGGEVYPLPGLTGGVVRISTKGDVPRGTSRA
jgi:16S rRNA (guanine527-N7)-methyltransferase